jgi:hypothetical protein
LDKDQAHGLSPRRVRPVLGRTPRPPPLRRASGGLP